uniref:G protein-coupled receptor 39 n=1 Tax=Leptobrachium leishanense TaxID=445787 RepID=A0A8C5MTL0_9ANUR
MPNQILRIMAASTPKQEWTVRYLRTYMTLFPIADTFFYLSSVLNPILYNISSKQFREVFLQVLRCHLTIEHANRAKFLHIQNSAKSSTNHKRPLIRRSFRPNYSSNTATAKPLNALQAETVPDLAMSRLVPTASSTDVHMEIEPSKNGLCESEI